MISSFFPHFLKEVKRINSAQTHAFLDGMRGVDSLQHLSPNLLVEGYNPRYDLITDEEIYSLRQDGMDVIPWTVNDEADIKRLVRVGVTGIITDFPQVLNVCAQMMSGKGREISVSSTKGFPSLFATQPSSTGLCS